MNKIMVIGPSGSGKSTFSRNLSKKINIPVYHLDNIFWNESKQHLTHDEFDQRLKEIIIKDKWIIDGDYRRTYELRIQQADTIFFLDYPLDICLDGVNNRIGTKREDCPFIENEFDEEFKEWIISWFKETRPELLELLNKYKEKNIIVFKTREEMNNYLNNIK